MHSSKLKQEAYNLLSQKLLPGRDQHQIRQSITRLDDIIQELSARNEPAAKTVLLRTQLLYEQAEQQLLQGVYNVLKPGLEETLQRLEDVLQKRELHPTSNVARYLLNHQSLQAQKSMSALGSAIKSFKHIPFSYVEAPIQDSSELRKNLQAHQLPVLIESMYRADPQIATKTLPNLELIGAPKAWEVASGEGITIGVIDSGCDYTHPEIASRFTNNKGYNFVDNNEDPMDEFKHGTHVAGTIAGSSVGVARGTTLYALKFLDRLGRGKSVGFLRAAEWAIDQKLDLLNGSFGGRAKNPADEMMCQQLHEKGILFVAAAGNDARNGYRYPAAYDTVISTAATDNDKKRAPFSQVNDQVTISAPGVGIRSCVLNGGYESLQGTSMAAPHITGTLALIKQTNKNPQAAKDVLLRTTHKLQPPEEYGVGFVRADKATHNARVPESYTQ